LEGTYNNHPVQLPDQFRADQKLKHIIKGNVQVPHKHWRAWGIDDLSRKPVPVSDQPLVKKCFLMSSLSFPRGQLWTIPI